jgi:hypothetical protein
MEDQSADRASGGMLALKRILSWLIIATSATTFVGFWHFLVFHASDPDPPVFWVYSAFVALVVAFAYTLIRLLESWAGQKWRFSLRALLAAMTIVAVTLGGLVYAIRR